MRATNVDLMLDQRRRRWTNIKSALIKKMSHFHLHFFAIPYAFSTLTAEAG